MVVGRGRGGQAALVALMVAPVVILAVTASAMATAAMNRGTHERAEATAVVGASLVEAQLLSLGELVQSYANRPTLVSAIQNRDQPLDDPAVLPQLGEVRRQIPGFAAAFVTDTAGRITEVSPATPGVLGKSFAFRDWYRGVRATGRAYVSEVYQSAATGHPRVVAVAAPIRSADRSRVVGYFVGAYSTNVLQDYIDGLSARQRVGLTVVDQRGVLVARPGSRPTGYRPYTAAWIRPTLDARPVNSARLVSQRIDSLGWGVASRVAPDAGAQRDRMLLLTLLALLLTVQLIAGWLLLRAQSARSRAESQRAESALRLQKVLDASSDGVVATDLDGRIVMVNRAACRMLGYTADDLLGLRSHEALHHASPTGEHLPARECPLHSPDRHDSASRADGEVLWRQDGTALPVIYSVAPMRENGRPIGAVETFTDVTERTRYERELTLMSQEAQAANRAKSQFLANMSHEIRTPMNGVLGMTALLQRTPLSTEQREYATTVQRSAEALLALINDVLDLSKVEAGQLHLDLAPMSLRDLVEDAAALVAPDAHSRGIELVTRIAPDVPEIVLGDSGRMRQVVVNLVGNATRFTERGEVTILADVTDTRDSQVTVRLRVRDTGLGIPQSQRERIFEVFSQVDMSSTRRHGGTGLGLAISRQLVQAMGGRIEVTSEVGQGSEFSVTVPFGRADAVVPADRAPAELRGLRALLVDDNETNLRVLEGMLGFAGVRTTSVSSAARAEEALRDAVARDELFDLALVDYLMPDIDGLGLLDRIRAEPWFPQLRVVVLTSAGATDQARIAEEYGVDCLPKPVREMALLDVLVQSSHAGSAPAEGEVAKSDAESAPYHGRRVLVVEDNPVNQTVATLMLTRLGCEVEVVPDGAAAVEATARGGYDLVFMDCQMPVLDGFAATERIRSAERGTGRRLPIVAMTAGAMVEEEQRCLDCGMDGFLAKPIALDRLDAALRRFAGASAGSSAD